MQYRSGRAVRRRARLVLTVSLACLLAMAGCGTPSPSGSSRPGHGPAAPLPAVSGHLLRPLWQRTLAGGLVFDGGTVLSLRYRPAGVYAVSAATGAVIWSARVPGGLQAYGLVPGNGIVIVEAGHLFGHAPALVFGAVTEYVAVDLRTGSRLWMTSLPGHLQNPPIAISGDLMLTADLSGAIIARLAATGRVVWRRPPPSACWRRGPGPLATAIALAADATRVVASFSCSGYRALVQMLNPATGRMSWSWEPAQSVGAQTDLAVTGVARRGDVVLLTGQDAPPNGPGPFARTVPLRYWWPASLGPLDDIQVVLALDATTGRTRWIELGGQGVNFTLADGAVCETVDTGMECRDDVTGMPTRPVEVSGQTASSTPPYGGDGYAGINGSLAGVTVAPFGVGHVLVQVLPIRGNRSLGQAELATGTSPASASHATEQPFVVAASTLPDGHTVLLLRRVDVPSDPVIALEVQQ